MSRILKQRQGSAIITAVGLGFILTLIIVMLHIFTSHRVQTVVREGESAKALGIAEAGLELIIAELYTNSSFTTHKLNADLTWGSALNWTSTLENNSAHGLVLDNKGSGTYSGKLGDGSFKVKIGLIPYQDNENTKTIDESKAYLKVEALGRYADTVRQVTAVLNRRFPAREFLMYDGGILSLVFGQPALTNTNYFSVGHLYGHKGIEIGQILMSRHSPASPGTKQELNEMNAILSGNGGIYIYSPIKAKFFAKNTQSLVDFVIPTNTTFPTNGTYDDPTQKEHGAFPRELTEKLPKIPETLKPWIKDKEDGFSISPRSPAFELYKTEAEKSDGLFISSGKNSSYMTKYQLPHGWKPNTSSLDVAYLDFGTGLHDGNVKVPANGVIYSDNDIVIKGNPDANVSIISTKNIFIAGDFNQRGDPDDPDFRYGFPQDYDDKALISHNYKADLAELLKTDATREKKYHYAATVIAKERIVYDYRSPVDCFENEIFPFMKYELAKAITADEAFSKANCLEKNQAAFKCAAADVDAFKDNIKDFFVKYPFKDTPTEEAIISSFASVYENSADKKISFDKFEEMNRELWAKYAKNYEASGGTRGVLSNAARTLEYGVYKLLDGLRDKIKTVDVSGDYLYFPEITCNGMFISCGKQKNTFYAGPDVAKYYNKIGLVPSNNIGLKHSDSPGFIHRMYGSEVNLRLYDVHEIKTPGHNYIPPTRRKIYDESLPTLGLDDDNQNKFELAGFVILAWSNYASNASEFNGF
jgi:hypothetical protein